MLLLVRMVVGGHAQSPNKNALRSHSWDEEQRGIFVVPPTFAFQYPQRIDKPNEDAKGL